MSDDPRRPAFLIRRHPSVGGVSSRDVQQRAELHPQILSVCDDRAADVALPVAHVLVDVPDVECDPDADDAPASVRIN